MTESFSLDGKVAAVTGASRGLGSYMAKALARAGADVVITSRSDTSLADTQKAIEETGRRAYPVRLDVRDQESISDFSNLIESDIGKLDILVNNAGCNVRKAAVDITWEDWDTVVGTNLKGMFFVSTSLAPLMIKRAWGRIINIGSLTTVFGYGGLGPYCASRGGVKQLTMSLADEWGSDGITVNCLSPGWFRTAQTAVLFEDSEWVDYLTDRIPVKRPGLPNDLDGVVVFLASEASEYITGQTILVDGGFSTGGVRWSGNA